MWGHAGQGGVFLPMSMSVFQDDSGTSPQYQQEMEKSGKIELRRKDDEAEKILRKPDCSYFEGSRSRGACDRAIS